LAVTKQKDSGELDFRALVEFLRAENPNPYEIDIGGNDPAKRRLVQLLTSGPVPSGSYDFAKLRDDLDARLNDLFSDDSRFDQAERLEHLLARTHQLSQSQDRYDDVSRAGRTADYPVPYKLITLGRQRYAIKTVTDDRPPILLYRILDAAIRDDLLQKLTNCPTCKKWFLRVTKRKKVCSDRCAPSSSKDSQRKRAKNSRTNKAASNVKNEL
jgi:hypothetical protein